MLRDELLELGAQGGVPAGGQFRVDPVLDHLQPEGLESLDLEPGERLELQIGQRPTAPQRLRFPQQPRGPGRVAVPQRLPPVGYLLLERVQVQLAIRDPQQIAGRLRLRGLPEPPAVAPGQGRDDHAPADGRRPVREGTGHPGPAAALARRGSPGARSVVDGGEEGGIGADQGGVL